MNPLKGSEIISEFVRCECIAYDTRARIFLFWILFLISDVTQPAIRCWSLTSSC
jgi:hypothetical protein